MIFQFQAISFGAQNVIDPSDDEPQIVLRGKVIIPDGVDVGQLHGSLESFWFSSSEPFEFDIDRDGCIEVKTLGLRPSYLRINSKDHRWQAYQILDLNKLVQTARDGIVLRLDKSQELRFRLSSKDLPVKDGRAVVMNSDGVFSKVSLIDRNGEAIARVSSRENILAVYGTDSDGHQWQLSPGKKFCSKLCRATQPCKRFR